MDVRWVSDGCHVQESRGLGLITLGLGLGLRLGLEQLFERRTRDRTRVDGVCDFEKKVRVRVR